LQSLLLFSQTKQPASQKHQPSLLQATTQLSTMMFLVTLVALFSVADAAVPHGFYALDGSDRIVRRRSHLLVNDQSSTVRTDR
jgi:uncharacterized membrane protein YkgB